jgi:hypothetical protein
MEIKVALLASERPTPPLLLAFITDISLSHVQLKLMLMPGNIHLVRQLFTLFLEHCLHL